MSKEPFSPTGVQNKFKTLYALLNPALNLEAESMKTDFKAWITANFTLTGDQSVYLRLMDTNLTQTYGGQTSIAARNRLPVTLFYPPQPPGYSKLTEMTDNLVVNPDGTATGSLIFTMKYRPKP